jgi:hypothetical protein
MTTVLTIALVVYLLGVGFVLWAAAYLRTGPDTTDDDRRVADAITRNAWAWPWAYATYALHVFKGTR